MNTLALLLLVSYTTLGAARPLDAVHDAESMWKRVLEMNSVNKAWTDCPKESSHAGITFHCNPPLHFDKGFKRGGDVTYTATTASVKECAEKCKTYADCAAINYVVASRECDMISKPINGTNAEGTTSALVQAECNNICDSGNIVYGFHRSGSDDFVFQTHFVETPEECCRICSTTAICESWDYGHAHTHCYLKTKVPEIVEGLHHDHVYTGFGCGGDYHASPSPASTF